MDDHQLSTIKCGQTPMNSSVPSNSGTSIASADNHHYSDLENYLNEGRKNFNHGQCKKAIKFYDEALMMANDLNALEYMYDILFESHLIYRAIGQNHLAYDKLKLLRKQLENTDNIDGKCEVYKSEVDLCQKLDLFLEADNAYNNYLQLKPLKFQKKRSVSKSQRRSSNLKAFKRTDSNSSSTSDTTQDDHDNDDGEVNSSEKDFFYQIALNEYRLGHYECSIEYFKKVLIDAIDANNQYLEEKCRWHMALANVQRGKLMRVDSKYSEDILSEILSEATFNLSQISSVCEDSIGFLYGDIGDIYYDMQQMDNALHSYEIEIEFAIQQKRPVDQSRIHMNIAHCHAFLEDYESALDHFNQAEYFARTFDQQELQIEIYNEMSSIYFEVGDYLSAVKHASDSIKIMDKMNNHHICLYENYTNSRRIIKNIKELQFAEMIHNIALKAIELNLMESTVSSIDQFRNELKMKRRNKYAVKGFAKQ